eukprot:s5723_g6.t1
MLLLLQAEGKFPHIVGAVDSCSAVWGRGDVARGRRGDDSCQGMLHLKSGQILNQSMGAERCQGDIGALGFHEEFPRSPRFLVTEPELAG